MFKSMVITIFAGLALLASLPLTATMVNAGGDEPPALPAARAGTSSGSGGGTAAASDGDGESARERTQRIWAGLWNGANLNTSATLDDGPDAGTGRTTTPRRTATPKATISTEPSDRYIALGDSVAAGAGLPRLADGTYRDRSCKRSAESYPYLVAQARGLELVHAACSGAKATNLFLFQGLSGQPNPSRQISYIFAGGRPELVTVTAGANDIYWREAIYRCYTGGCGPDARNRRITDSDATRVLREGVDKKYETFFNELELRSNGRPPRVVVTGYYNPVSRACLSQVPQLSAGELQWITDQVAALNRTLEDVTRERPYARFAPVDFRGHDVCSADSWIIPPGQPDRLHPNAAGQRAIADAVLRAL